MKTILLAFAAALLFTSCNNSRKKDPVPGNEETAKPVTGCYRYTTAKDTIAMEISDSNGTINGTLVFQIHEKDKNTGTIRGHMQGNLLIADYTFQSEGSISTRQVVFKKQGDHFVEGYGEINTDDNRQPFKDIHSLQYNDAVRLSAIDCGNQ